jgi:N6-adenosine-specific RNA methylase IME4
MIPFPDKKYQIIYADPPWRYKEQLVWEKKCIYPLEKFYPTMELEDIKNLSIPASKDCWLILWTTIPKLIEGLEVLKAWNFEYRTSAVWDKGNGLGYFFRIYHEIILIGKRGNPPKPNYSESSVFKEPRRQHSKKPDCVRNWINKAFPDLSKIELFARQKVDGWDCWGNEV